MNKFTSGPWYSVSSDVYKDIGDTRFLIAQGEGWGDETVPNAKLIAAAPELYDALEDILLNYKENKGKGLGIGPIMKAKAALAKARGEE
jgi:hypothetical protein